MTLVKQTVAGSSHTTVEGGSSKATPNATGNNPAAEITIPKKYDSRHVMRRHDQNDEYGNRRRAKILTGKNTSRNRTPVSWLVESPGKPINREWHDSSGGGMRNVKTILEFLRKNQKYFGKVSTTESVPNRRRGGSLCWAKTTGPHANICAAGDCKAVLNGIGITIRIGSVIGFAVCY